MQEISPPLLKKVRISSYSNETSAHIHFIAAFDQARQVKRARIEVCDALQTQSQRRMESLQTGWSILSEKLRDELGLLQDKVFRSLKKKA